MLRAIILVPEAVVDVADAYEWYEDRAIGLGDDFLNSLDVAYALIAEHPIHYPVRFDSFRRILLDRFPYAIYYEHDDQTVFVHYVFHCSQDPAKLNRRLNRPSQ